jgi:hypothetical protein
VGAAVPAPRRRLLPLVRVSCCAPGNPNASPPPRRRRQRRLSFVAGSPGNIRACVPRAVPLIFCARILVLGPVSYAPALCASCISIEFLRRQQFLIWVPWFSCTGPCQEYFIEFPAV